MADEEEGLELDGEDGGFQDYEADEEAATGSGAEGEEGSASGRRDGGRKSAQLQAARAVAAAARALARASGIAAVVGSSRSMMSLPSMGSPCASLTRRLSTT